MKTQSDKTKGLIVITMTLKETTAVFIKAFSYLLKMGLLARTKHFVWTILDAIDRLGSIDSPQRHQVLLEANYFITIIVSLIERARLKSSSLFVCFTLIASKYLQSEYLGQTTKTCLQYRKKNLIGTVREYGSVMLIVSVKTISEVTLY